MRQKYFLYPLAILAALFATQLSAQQLPGNISLGSVYNNGYYDQTVDGRNIRLYYNGWLPKSPSYYQTAALVANPRLGSVPSCDYSSSNRKWVSAYGRMYHGFHRGTSVLWKACATTSYDWGTSGLKLLFSTYPGSYRPSGTWDFYGNVILPRVGNPLPIATEWSAW
jgi:hypothetical protein